MTGLDTVYLTLQIYVSAVLTGLLIVEVINLIREVRRDEG